MIKAAIDLAGSFGLTTGPMESRPKSSLRLTALDCDLAQRYLWSRQVEVKEVTEVMEKIGKVAPGGLLPAAGDDWTAIA